MSGPVLCRPRSCCPLLEYEPGQVQAGTAGGRSSKDAAAGRHEFVRGLGVDALLDHHTQDVTTPGERWNVILDSPGVHSLAQLRPALAHDAVVIFTRPLSLDALRGLAPRRLAPDKPRLAGVMTRARSQDLAHLAARSTAADILFASTVTCGLRTSFP